MAPIRAIVIATPQHPTISGRSISVPVAAATTLRAGHLGAMAPLRDGHRPAIRSMPRSDVDAGTRANLDVDALRGGRRGYSQRRSRQHGSRGRYNKGELLHGVPLWSSLDQ